MSRSNPADSFCDALLQLQLERSTKKQSVAVVLSALTVICLSALIWILPQKDFSENENRYLQGLPSLTLLSLTDGSFSEELSDYCNDHFPFRDFFVSLNSYIGLALGKSEAGGVIVGSNGVLAMRPDETADGIYELESNLKAMSALSERFEGYGLDCLSVAIPYGHKTHRSALPSVWSNDRADISLPSDVVDLTETLCAEDGTFFKTDHHWTAKGAFIAYKTLGDSLGYTPLSDFTPVLVSSDFLGTLWSRSGLYLTPPDELELYRFDGDDGYLISGDITSRGFYDLSKLSTKDKYGVFLGGNYSHITVKGNTDRPRLLIIKDSYANALVPFLARHFELEIIDPRYYRGDVDTLAKTCDKVLFVYGVSSLFSGRDLVKLALK